MVKPAHKGSVLRDLGGCGTVKEDRTVNAVNIPSKGTSSLSEFWCRRGTSPVEVAEKLVERPGPAAPVPKNTTLTDSIAPDFLLGAQEPIITTSCPEGDEDDHGILVDECCADDGPFQERFLLQEFIFAHCQ